MLGAGYVGGVMAGGLVGTHVARGAVIGAGLSYAARAALVVVGTMAMIPSAHFETSRVTFDGGDGNWRGQWHWTSERGEFSTDGASFGWDGLRHSGGVGLDGRDKPPQPLLDLNVDHNFGAELPEPLLDLTERGEDHDDQ